MLSAFVLELALSPGCHCDRQGSIIGQALKGQRIGYPISRKSSRTVG